MTTNPDHISKEQAVNDEAVCPMCPHLRRNHYGDYGCTDGCVCQMGTARYPFDPIQPEPPVSDGSNNHGDQHVGPDGPDDHPPISEWDEAEARADADIEVGRLLTEFEAAIRKEERDRVAAWLASEASRYGDADVVLALTNAAAALREVKP